MLYILVRLLRWPKLSLAIVKMRISKNGAPISKVVLIGNIFAGTGLGK